MGDGVLCTLETSDVFRLYANQNRYDEICTQGSKTACIVISKCTENRTSCIYGSPCNVDTHLNLKGKKEGKEIEENRNREEPKGRGKSPPMHSCR